MGKDDHRPLDKPYIYYTTDVSILVSIIAFPYFPPFIQRYTVLFYSTLLLLVVITFYKISLFIDTSYILHECT